MNSTNLAIAGLLAVSGTSPLWADLPNLKEKNWIGSFIAYEGKTYQYSVLVNGKGEINVIGRKGTPLNSRISMGIELGVGEQFPDGRLGFRALEAESLESANEPTMELKNIIIKGKVQGGAAFEAYISEEHGAISIGGKLLDPGAVASSNPLKFAVRVKVPDVYPWDTGGDPAKGEAPGNNRDKDKDKEGPSGDKPEKADRGGRANRDKDDESSGRDKEKDREEKSGKDDKEDSKRGGGGSSRNNRDKDKDDKPAFINANDPKSLAEKMKEDRVQFVWTDGKRSKPATSTVLNDEKLKEINGPGIMAAELFFSPYQDKKFILAASGSSTMTLTPASYSSAGAPLFRGCYLSWTADPAKDPESKARLKVDVK